MGSRSRSFLSASSARQRQSEISSEDSEEPPEEDVKVKARFLDGSIGVEEHTNCRSKHKPSTKTARQANTDNATNGQSSVKTRGSSTSGDTRSTNSKKTASKKIYDQHTQELPELKIGEEIRLRPLRGQDGWQKAECVAPEGSRTYLVKEKSTGQVLRRNRIDIREEKSAPETPSKDSRESAVDSNTQGNEEQESQAEKKDATGSQQAKQSADFTEQPEKNHCRPGRDTNLNTSGPEHMDKNSSSSSMLWS